MIKSRRGLERHELELITSIVIEPRLAELADRYDTVFLALERASPVTRTRVIQAWTSGLSGEFKRMSAENIELWLEPGDNIQDFEN